VSHRSPWGVEKLVLHKLRVHPKCVSPFFIPARADRDSAVAVCERAALCA
jgi:hypothetical protein